MRPTFPISDPAPCRPTFRSTFTMFDYKGLASYRGSLARNVTSRSWGSWGNSFRFKSVVDLSCGGTNNQNLLVNATATTQVAVCPANCFQAGGEVYGSAATGYRSNSLVCRAALHAGVINNNGGAVIVRWVPGLSSYKGVKGGKACILVCVHSVAADSSRAPHPGWAHATAPDAIPRQSLQGAPPTSSRRRPRQDHQMRSSSFDDIARWLRPWVCLARLCCRQFLQPPTSPSPHAPHT